MVRLGMPVPAGFIISTEASTELRKGASDHFRAIIFEDIKEGIAQIEQTTGKQFGTQSRYNSGLVTKVPLQVSVRSNATFTALGIMDAVLDLGINEEILEIMISLSHNPRWAYDTYRRFIQTFSIAVLNKDANQFEEILNDIQLRKGYKSHSEFTVTDLVEIVQRFKELTNEIPDDPWEQLKMATNTLLTTWGKRHQYRVNSYFPEEIKVGVIVQNMVYGNKNVFSGSGIVLTRNPISGEIGLCGEYLPTSSGEEFVAGVRVPLPLVDLQKNQPKVYDQLNNCANTLEKYFRDVQVSHLSYLENIYSELK
jgi:pyruvate, orthophosphate dikinase